ncbi:MAG: hypothetical protein AAB393_04430, partial [Bacteroidota bacterium]
MRARSVENLVVLDASQETSKTETVIPAVSTSTSVEAAIKASDEIVNRPVFFVPEPEIVRGINVISPGEPPVSASIPRESSLPAPPVVAPGLQDSDGDGLTNDQELQLGTDLSKADTDGDGLSDGDETKKYRTDPKKTNTDG